MSETRSTDNISELVDQLDARVSRGGARVQLRQYGGGPDETQIVANRAGYLRLGIEFMKAGLSNAQSDNSVSLELDYLLTEDSDVGINWAEQRDPVETAADPPTVWGRVAGWFVTVALGACALLFVFGTCHGARTLLRAVTD